MTPLLPRAETLLRDSTWLRRLVAGMSGDAHLADDVAQDVAVLALTQPPRRDDSWRGWLTTVARTVMLRRRVRARLAAQSERAATRAEATPSTHDVVVRAEAHAHVVDAVLALDEPYRTVILLRYFDGMKTGAIATALGCPVATVRTRLVRGTQRLRTALEPRFGASSSWAALFAWPTMGATGAATKGGLAAGSGWTITTGSLWMSTQTKTLVAVAALLALGVSALFWSDDVGPADEARAAPPVATAGASPEAAAAMESAATVKSSDPAQTVRTTATPPHAAASAIPDDVPGQGLLVFVHDEHGAPVADARVWHAEAPLVLALREDAHSRGSGARRLHVLGADAEEEMGGRQGSPPIALLQRMEPGSTAEREDDAASVAGEHSLPPTPELVVGIGPRLLARTDRRGVCRVPATPGTRLVATDDRGRVSQYEALDAQAHTTFAALCVGDGVRIFGRVRDAKGKPASQAAVHVVVVDPATGQRDMRAEARIATEADGTFACVLPPSRLEIAVSGSQGDLRSAWVFARNRSKLELRLLPQSIVTGRVTDPFGVPCADAVVTAIPTADGQGLQKLLELARSVTTDREGRYELAIPEDSVLLASHPQWAPTDPQRVSGRRGNAIADFQLGSWGQLIGEVRWTDGKPIAGATVSAYPDRPPGAPAVTAEADGKGLYEIQRLRPELRFRLVCVPDPTRPWVSDERTGVVTGTQSFVFDPAVLEGSSLSLRALSPDGRPFVGTATVTLHDRGRQPARTVRVTFDDRGEGTLTSLPVRGAISATALADGLVCELPAVKAGTQEPVPVQFEPACSVRVRVTYGSRRAAPGVRLQLSADRSRVAGTIGRTDAHGVATFDGLPPGKYRVHVLRGDGLDDTSATAHLVPGAPVELDVRL
ncbi:MAG: sigma-70 family RNA polymerase sigma factor [Planctomycetota bacterium]